VVGKLSEVLRVSDFQEPDTGKCYGKKTLLLLLLLLLLFYHIIRTVFKMLLEIEISIVGNDSDIVKSNMP
jgi:hypothetical protein